MLIGFGARVSFGLGFRVYGLGFRFVGFWGFVGLSVVLG